jgi:hypothetical protein
LVADQDAFLSKMASKACLVHIPGIFSKQTTGVCRRAGQLVNEELFSFASIEQKITDPGNFEKLMPDIEMQADRFLRIKLPAQMIIGKLVGERTLNEMKPCL